MSLIDKLTGRVKQAIGKVTGDGSLHRQGRREEIKGEKKQELEHAEERVEEKAQEVGGHEFETWNRVRAPGRSAGHSPPQLFLQHTEPAIESNDDASLAGVVAESNLSLLRGGLRLPG